MPPPPTTTRSAVAPWLVFFASLVGAGLLLAAVLLAFPSAEEKKKGRGRLPRNPPIPRAPREQAPPVAATGPAPGVAETPAPPFSLAAEPSEGPKWELPGGSHAQFTPDYPVECTAATITTNSAPAATTTARNDTNESNITTSAPPPPPPTVVVAVTACVMRVPMYIMVVNRVQEAFNLTVIASKANAVVQRNATHETRVVIQTVFVDNTGCGRKNRVRHPHANHFESHAELVGTDFDCAEWSETIKSVRAQFGANVLTPPVPLTFGPTQNWVQQDALERRGVPRYMWAHADAAVDGPEPLTRLALAAATVRHPFCVLFSHYDIIAVFDAYSVAREVGDWDAHLWYHGDVDYYSRCRHAKLPWGEASGHDVHHVGKGSTTVNNENLGRKVMKRFQTLGRMYQEYHQSRGATLDIAPFDLPPKNKTLFGAWVNFRDAQRIPSPAAGLADVVSRHMGRWMYPYRFVVRREDDAEGGVARLAVKLEYLPVDLAREDSPVSGEQAQQDLRASLVAATHADEADIYIPR